MEFIRRIFKRLVNTRRPTKNFSLPQESLDSFLERTAKIFEEEEGPLVCTTAGANLERSVEDEVNEKIGIITEELENKRKAKQSRIKTLMLNVYKRTNYPSEHLGQLIKCGMKQPGFIPERAEKYGLSEVQLDGLLLNLFLYNHLLSYHWGVVNNIFGPDYYEPFLAYFGELDSHYQSVQDKDLLDREKIAAEFGLQEAQVEIWFRCRRMEQEQTEKPFVFV